LPRKELYKTGCTYFEYMLQEMKGRPATGRQEGLTVLYATGWGPRSSVPEYGTTIVERLSREGIRVIFRPHPHSYVSEPRIMRDMEERISRSPLAELDRNRTGIGSMERADIMIADLSGVLFDWAFLYGKPVILANSEADLGGQEGEDLSGEVWDIETSKRLAAHCLSDQDLLRIPEIVERASRESHQHADTIRDVRDREIYNFGSAGPAAAENIRNILRGVV
jgi:CDP-glycerol glycerophosphotransferase (TagB/SpsB family)